MPNTGGSDVDPHVPLMEAGLDSLGAVELRSALSSAFNVELPATLTFDHPTIAALGRHLAAIAQPLVDQVHSAFLVVIPHIGCRCTAGIKARRFFALVGIILCRNEADSLQ